MSEPQDPSGGWAKAVEKTSEMGTELTKAAVSFGRFIKDPSQELLGMIVDHLKVVRWERRVRLQDRVLTFMEQRKLSAPTRHIAAATIVPLLDFATLEEDDQLQDRYAKMLVNAGDASHETEMRRAYVNVLADMTAFDVRNLDAISRVSGDERSFVDTYLLPDKSTRAQENLSAAPLDDKVAVSLGNLVRLGLLEPALTFGGLSLSRVRMTPLGVNFCLICR